jgi:hypothetical protein
MVDGCLYSLPNAPWWHLSEQKGHFFPNPSLHFAPSEWFFASGAYFFQIAFDHFAYFVPTR